ncbi:MAG: hypothetical protein HYU48_02665 [Candidatus Levybacteria bacterium]|nr:hypothetical protein [Candidatus Levybacteria bacterium]
MTPKLLWLTLIQNSNQMETIINDSNKLIEEAREFIRIFTSSIITSEKNKGLK